MNEPTNPDRREFFERSIAGAAALGVVGARSSSVPGAEPPPRRKTKIRIGTRINAEWMKSKDDVDLRFLKQIGVDYVDITLDLINGYRETGCFTKADLHELISRLATVGLSIERANSIGTYYVNAHLNRPEGQPEIDNLRKIGDLLADADIPVFGIQACQAAVLAGKTRVGWSRPRGRGGYRHYAFDLAEATRAAAPVKQKVTHEQLWKGVLNIYRQVMPTVDGSKTRIAMHGNDPPLPGLYGYPQILCRFADFDRLFREVPSKNTGITFCVGTRYESGQNIFEGIRHFGEQGKLFHVHFRNVRGTLPSKKGYEEVFMDDGDIDMPKVVGALQAVGYDGVIDYDHPMAITGDQPLPKQYIAFSVGYMRALLQQLNRG